MGDQLGPLWRLLLSPCLSPSPALCSAGGGRIPFCSKDTAINLQQTWVFLRQAGIPLAASGEQIASPALPLPRPLLLHGSWIPGQHPWWFPVLCSWCLASSPFLTQKGNQSEDA